MDRVTAAFSGIAKALAGAAARSEVVAEVGELFGSEEFKTARHVEHSLDALRGEIDLGAGNTLTLDPEALKEFLFSEEMLEQVAAAGEAVAAEANRLAEIEGSEYISILQSDRNYDTPRALVVANNYKARLDDAHHGTLTKAQVAVAGAAGMDANVIPVTW